MAAAAGAPATPAAAAAGPSDASPPAPTDDEAAMRLRLFPRGLPGTLDPGHYCGTSSDSDFSYGQEVFQKAVAAERREREKQALLEEQARKTKVRMQAAMSSLVAALPQAPESTNVEYVVARASDYMAELQGTVDSASHESARLKRKIASLRAAQSERDADAASHLSLSLGSDAGTPLARPAGDGPTSLAYPGAGPGNVPPWIPRGPGSGCMSPIAAPVPRRVRTASNKPLISPAALTALRQLAVWAVTVAVFTATMTSPSRLAMVLRSAWERAAPAVLIRVPYRCWGVNVVAVVTAWAAIFAMRKTRALVQLACYGVLHWLGDEADTAAHTAGPPVASRNTSHAPSLPPMMVDVDGDGGGTGRRVSRGTRGGSPRVSLGHVHEVGGGGVVDDGDARAAAARPPQNPHSTVKSKAQSNVMAYLYSEGIEPRGVVVEGRATTGDGARPAFRCRTTSYHPDGLPSPHRHPTTTPGDHVRPHALSSASSKSTASRSRARNK